jgi:hypothetical protein
MTPGQLADRAWTSVNQASGALGAMVVKKRLTKAALTEVLGTLESASIDIREILRRKE